MIKIPRNTIFISLLFTCLLTMPFIAKVPNCYAKEKQDNQQHSKDFKKFPDGSPEARLTAFVESDLKDNDYRNIRLTELRTIPDDNYPKLFINTYNISNKYIDDKTGNVTLNLEMDVRIIWPKGNIEKTTINQKAKSIYVNGIEYSSNSTQFVEAVFNKTEIATKEMDYYSVPHNKRNWVFPVKMVNKQGKWLLATNTIPFKSCYISTEINLQKKFMEESIAMNDVCRGKRKFNPNIIQRKLNYIKEKIGKDLEKYKAEFCTADVIEAREWSIKEDTKIIQQLESAAQE